MRSRKEEHFASSESPAYIGRAVLALVSDEKIMKLPGRSLATWNLANEYVFTDADGSQPDWGTHFKQKVVPQLGAIIDELQWA